VIEMAMIVVCRQCGVTFEATKADIAAGPYA
jgi:hypothetical protein